MTTGIAIMTNNQAPPMAPSACAEPETINRYRKRTVDRTINLQAGRLSGNSDGVLCWQQMAVGARRSVVASRIEADIYAPPKRAVRR